MAAGLETYIYETYSLLLAVKSAVKSAVNNVEISQNITPDYFTTAAPHTDLTKKKGIICSISIQMSAEKHSRL